MTEKVLLTVETVAARLGVTTARGYELVREHIIPSVRLGRQIRVDPDQLEEFIRSGGQSLSGGWRKAG